MNTEAKEKKKAVAVAAVVANTHPRRDMISHYVPLLFCHEVVGYIFVEA